MSDTAPRRSHADQQILVVGADGMMGRRLVTAFEREGKSVWGTTRNPMTVEGKRVYLDLASDVDHFEPPFLGAGTAILCAANTTIDQCQREPWATRRVNVDNTVALAKKFLEAGMFVIFPSSNTVFDGCSAFPTARDVPNPPHEYGRQKADAEKQLLRMGKSTAVIRFSKIIAPNMPLLSGWIRGLLSGEAVHPFSDAVMAPISAVFATELVCRVATYQHPGVTQASATHDISYASAAKYLATKIAADINLIKPISCKNVGLSGFPDHATLDTTELVKLGLEAPVPTRALDQFFDLTFGGPAQVS
jgi:dTDP-4-dehydrorhamnose reductase